jgi:signal transduction histidine kinase/ActR/RegA family two-component response regulator
MESESIELHLQRLKQQQELILNQVTEAIALFNSDHRLILFNGKLAQILNLPPAWLNEHPHVKEVCQRLIIEAYLSPLEGEKIASFLLETNPDQAVECFSFLIHPKENLYLELSVTVTCNGSKLLNLRDITNEQQSTANLNYEVKKLKFLLGLTERLQSATEITEIGQFALSYLVKAMGANFGDVKVIDGEGTNRQAGMITNEISSEFIATYGEAVKDMEHLLKQGIPYGQGLLWQVVETGQPLLVEDYQNHPQSLSNFRHPAIGKLGIFPIPGLGGKIIGVLTLESRTGNGLQKEAEQDMLLAACRTLGFAIERAQSEANLRQINQELEKASQLKSEFLASMSHELRTPLNSIIGFSELLQRQSKNNLTPRQINHIQTIAKSGQHLLQLINDILDLSKIEAGKTELSLQPVSLQLLCTDSLKMIKPRAEKKRLTVSCEFDYNIEQAILDERRVKQILINLLSNAVKFTPEQGKIKLSVKLAYGTELLKENRPDCSPINISTPYLCLAVSDTGIGIPPEQQYLLFKPFQQVDSSLTRRHEGTGLGLALTKRLAELHGGTVSIESKENEGSTFKVWLPLTENRQELNALKTSEFKLENNYSLDNRESVIKSQQKRILVVEDQPFNQVLITEILELEGYKVEIVYDGGTMLELIESPLININNLPDLILMDIQLPNVDGFQLIKNLKANKNWCDIPIIAVTAMAMSGDKQRCLEAGADYYLSKPLNLKQLIKSIEILLDKNNILSS